MRISLLLFTLYVSMIFVARQIQEMDKKEVSENPPTGMNYRTDGLDIVETSKSQYKAFQIDFKENDFGDVTELSYIEKY